MMIGFAEYQNVQGKLADVQKLLVFEVREDEFLIVPRQALFEWSKEIAARNGGKMTKCKAKHSKDARYKYFYTRYNRDDLITQVYYKDMIEGVSGVEIWINNII